jgi:hypothetical protein
VANPNPYEVAVGSTDAAMLAGSDRKDLNDA